MAKYCHSRNGGGKQVSKRGNVNYEPAVVPSIGLGDIYHKEAYRLEARSYFVERERTIMITQGCCAYG